MEQDHQAGLLPPGQISTDYYNIHMNNQTVEDRTVSFTDIGNSIVISRNAGRTRSADETCARMYVTPPCIYITYNHRQYFWTPYFALYSAL